MKHEFVVPLYNVTVEIYVSKDMASCIKTINNVHSLKVENSKCEAKSLMFTSCSEVRFAMLFQDNGHDLSPFIAHEALHLSWYICDYVGISINGKNHEAQAYLLEHIVAKANNFLI